MSYILKSERGQREFLPLELCFEDGEFTNVFCEKNNKSVAETLEHRRYVSMRAEVEAAYPEHLGQPLGDFLLELKQRGDATYKRFLNRYGDETFCRFRITDRTMGQRAGVYAYTVGGTLKYIGRCRDSMWKRINQGYGKIHPKNCYLDGQATNCHLNAKIFPLRKQIQLWFLTVPSEQIVALEKLLICEHEPQWNIQRG